MRILTDSEGVQWTVFEVKRQSVAKDRWSYLPEEFGDGWLCFESDGGKRRLSPSCRSRASSATAFVH